jgi:hypothetical protein
MRSDIFEKWHRTSCEEQHEKGPRPTVRTVGGPPCAISVPGDRSFGSDNATRVIIQECFKASMEQVGRRVCSVGEVKADLRLARRRDLKCVVLQPGAPALLRTRRRHLHLQANRQGAERG